MDPRAVAALTRQGSSCQPWASWVRARYSSDLSPQSFSLSFGRAVVAATTIIIIFFSADGPTAS